MREYQRRAEAQSNNSVQRKYIEDICDCLGDQIDDAYDYANAIASLDKAKRILLDEVANNVDVMPERFEVMLDSADLDWEGYEDDHNPADIFELPAHLEQRIGYMGRDEQLIGFYN